MLRVTQSSSGAEIEALLCNQVAVGFKLIDFSKPGGLFQQPCCMMCMKRKNLKNDALPSLSCNHDQPGRFSYIVSAKIIIPKYILNLQALVGKHLSEITQ